MKKNNLVITVIISIVLIFAIIFGVSSVGGNGNKFKNYAVPVSGDGTGFYRHC